MKEIYNEGRVVGLSAYELFLRNHPDPEKAPTEKEWLSSSVASGSSMIVRLPEVSGRGFQESVLVDIPFPAKSSLCAANTIIASYFLGECKWDNDDITKGAWATEVISYGPTIRNDSDASPSEGDVYSEDISTKVPGDAVSLEKDEIIKLQNYIRIIDGAVIQPGKWVPLESDDRRKDLQPNLSEYPVLRLSIAGTIESQHVPYVLLTGFTDTGVINSVSGLDGSYTSTDSENGDFLGPSLFPWASKVIFTTPTIYNRYGDRCRLTFDFGLQDNTSISPAYIQSGVFSDRKFHSISLPEISTGTGVINISGANDNTNTPLKLDPRGNLNWAILLEALANNRPISITQTAKNADMIKGGYGIEVDKDTDTGQVTIVNTAPNIDLNRWHTLIPTTSSVSGDYSVAWGPCYADSRGHVYFRNYFGAYPYMQTDEDKLEYRKKRSDYNGGITVQVVPIEDNNGQLKSCHIKVSSYGQNNYHLGCNNLAQYISPPNQTAHWERYAHPRHSSTPIPWESVICTINLGSFIQIKDKYYDLSKFKNVTSLPQRGNAIWNIHGIHNGTYKSLRGCWPVVCELRFVERPNEYNENQPYTDLAVVMVSIGDGWNDGFNNVFDDAVNVSAGDIVWTGNINMTLEGILS